MWLKVVHNFDKGICLYGIIWLAFLLLLQWLSFFIWKLQWCLFPHSEVYTTNLMINSISGMDTYSLFYIMLDVHSSYRNSCMCHFLIWISTEKGSCVLSLIHLIQFDMLKDHIQKQTVQDCFFCKLVICVFQNGICVYIQYVLILPTAVIILC